MGALLKGHLRWWFDCRTSNPSSASGDKSAAFFPTVNHTVADPATDTTSSHTAVNHTAHTAADPASNHPATNCASDVTADHRAAGAGHVVHPRAQQPRLLPVNQRPGPDHVDR